MKTKKYAATLKWSEEFELGNDLVDSQHKRLFELVSDIDRACYEGEDTDILCKTLDFLLQYTVLHFNDEEALQIKCNFPEYEKHKNMHNEFETIVSGKVAEFKEKGSTKDLSDAVNDFVIKWLLNHILKEDMRIKEYIS